MMYYFKSAMTLELNFCSTVINGTIKFKTDAYGEVQTNDMF